jgi:uncharacterized protein (TIGR02117 family)
MRLITLILTLGWSIVLNCGCSHHQSFLFRGQSEPFSETNENVLEHRPTFYLVGHGWHTGFVLKRNDIPEDIWPQQAGLPDNRYVEVGWGDSGFYQASKITLPITLKALFLPTASVMHVVGFDEPIKRFYPVSDIVELNVFQSQFRELCKLIHNTFEIDESGHPDPLGPGLYGNSTFYRSKGRYLFPKTCNVWTAQGLRKAGFSIIPYLSQTAGSILDRFGTTEPRFVDQSNGSPCGILFAEAHERPFLNHQNGYGGRAVTISVYWLC